MSRQAYLKNKTPYVFSVEMEKKSNDINEIFQQLVIHIFPHGDDTIFQLIKNIFAA